MAIAFSSTIHTLMSGYRVAGEQIAGFEIRYGDSDTLYKDVKTARMTLSGERDVDFAEANVGPMTYMPDVAAVYAQLKAAGMVEIFPDSLLLNPSTFSVIRISGSKITIDIEGGDSPFIFEKDDLATAVAALSNNHWKLPTVTFGQMSAAAQTYRESVDLELEDLGDSLAQEIVDRLAAVAAVQADVDLNESDSDAAISAEAAARAAADTTLQSNIDAEAAARITGDTSTLAGANSYTDTAVAGAQADIDQNEADSDAADAALSGRLDVLEADPTTATAVAAVQADVDQNEADSDAAEAALSARLDVLEADPTTATAVAAVQADVDQNEADADAALALKAPLADPDFTGQLEVDTNARLEFDSNLTKLHNVLRGTSIVVGNNITLNPAAADGRVEVEGEFYLRPSDLTNAADDTAAAAAGVIVGQVYHNNGALRVRLS